MDDWEKFNEALLTEDFFINLNIEDITDSDHTHGKRVFKSFQIKNLGEYHDFYIQRDTFLLADISNNFRNM